MYDELVKKIRHCATDPMHCLSCGEVKDGQCFKRLMTQAADAIDELSEQLDGMNEANIALFGALPKWIPVSERLPDVPGTYLVLMKEPKKFTEKRIKGEVEEWETSTLATSSQRFTTKTKAFGMTMISP